VAGKLASGAPVTIIAFGSSSTEGYGATSPEFTYPNRLAAQLHRQYPSADITVVTRGHGGDDAPEMMNRLQSSVLDMKPDLVIWQVAPMPCCATSIRSRPPSWSARASRGSRRRRRSRAGRSAIFPRVNERAQSASQIVSLLGKVAALRHVGFFPRFEVMREWHEEQAIRSTNS